MLYDDWHVFRRLSFTHALHPAHPSPLGRTMNISAAAGGPGTAHRPGSRFKHQTRLARLLAGPPWNNAQGGNICTLSPGDSQSFPFRCTETEDAPIRGRLSHLCGLKGEIRPFPRGEARRWVARRTGRREAHLPPSDFHTLDWLFSHGFQGFDQQPPVKTMQRVSNPTCCVKRAFPKDPNTHTHTHTRCSVPWAQGGGWSSFRAGVPSAAAATVTCWGRQLTLGSAAVSQSEAACSAQEGGDTMNLQRLPAVLGANTWRRTCGPAGCHSGALKGFLLKSPLKAYF